MTWKPPTVATIMVVLTGAAFAIAGAILAVEMYRARMQDPQRLGAVTEPAWKDDFDTEKKNREIAWCEGYGGVAAMTFTRTKSNVICLRREAVIELPGGDYDLVKKTEEYMRKSRELDRLKGTP